MKREEGNLTIEATISLTTFLFFMMFLLNFGQVYQAHNYVTHGLMQTGKRIAFASYEYSKENTLIQLADFFRSLQLFSDNSSVEDSIRLSFKNNQYGEAVKTAFPYCVGNGKDEVDAMLKQYGLPGGLNDLNFNDTNVVGDRDICLKVSYTVQFPFPFFSITSMKMEQQFLCRLWK